MVMPAAELSSNRSMMEETEYQKCGEIMVAPTGIFAMKCMHCRSNSIFKRLPSFMRHVHQFHGDEIKFQSNAASDLMVYAVEELVNRTLCDVYESEESGVAEDDLKSSEDDDDDDDDIVNSKAMTFKSLCQKGRPNLQVGTKGSVEEVKGAALANMSILNALEDCDVSLNFVENLDATIVDNNDEEEGKEVGPEETEFKKMDNQAKVVNNSNTKAKDQDTTSSECEEGEDGMEVSEDECDMDSTLLKRIQLDLDLDNDDVDHENPIKAAVNSKEKQESQEVDNSPVDDEEDQNVTLTEDNISKKLSTSSKSNKGGLKSLLSGLEDLDDVDDLLDNIEDSIICTEKENEEESFHEANLKSPHKSQKEEMKENNDEENLTESKDSMKYLAKDQGIPQKRVSALELRLMADLGLDEDDLEDCLSNSYMPEKEETAVVEEETDSKSPTKSEQSQKQALKPKTPKAVKGKVAPYQEITIKDNTEVCEDNKSSPKTRKNNIKDAADESCKKEDTPTSRITASNDTLKTPPTKRPRKSTVNSEIQAKESENVALEMCKNEGTPKSRKSSANDSLNTPSAKRPANTATEVIETEDLVEMLAKDTQKTPSTKRPRKSTAKPKIEVIESKDLVETTKFEDGLSEENSSTMFYSSPEKNQVGNENAMAKSLQSLLSKELDDEEDLDMLINQLETSTTSQDNENELNNTIISEEISKNNDEKNKTIEEEQEMDIAMAEVKNNEGEDNENELNKTIISEEISKNNDEKNKTIEEEQEMDIETVEVNNNEGDDEGDTDLDDEMAIFNKFIGLSSEEKEEKDQKEENGKDKEKGEIEGEDEKEGKGEIEAVVEDEKEEKNDIAAEDEKEEKNHIAAEDENEEKDVIGTEDEKEEKEEKQAEDEDEEESNLEIDVDKDTKEKETFKNEDAKENKKELKDDNRMNENEELQSEDELNESEELEAKEGKENNGPKEDEKDAEEENMEELLYETNYESDKKENEATEKEAEKKKKEDIDSEEKNASEADTDSKTEIDSKKHMDSKKEMHDVLPEEKELEAENKKDDRKEFEVEDPNKTVDQDGELSKAEAAAEDAEEDLDDFENMLNEDLTKALEQALGDEENDLLNMEEDSKENKGNEQKLQNTEHQAENDKKHTEIEMDDDNMEKIENHHEPELMSPPKPNKKSSQIRSQNKKSPLANVTKVPEEPYKGKFSKTNQKARNIQGKPVVNQEIISNTAAMALKEKNVPILLPKLTGNQLSKPLKISPKQESVLKQSKDLQENFPLEENFVQKTPSSRKIQQRKNQISASQIKKEKTTPARCFINTARGERTPLKVEDLFPKQSPKTQEKTGEKQSKTQSPKTPEDKKSPMQCKLDQVKAKLMKTPTTIKQTSPKKTEFNKSPTPTRDVDKSNFTTPQKTRNLSVKVLRCTPQQNRKQQLENISDNEQSPRDFKSPSSSNRQEKTPEIKNTSPRDVRSRSSTSPTTQQAMNNAEVSSKFKLPKGITISKVSASTIAYPTTVEITPTRSNYCKQNFTENSLQEKVEILGEKSSFAESLIKGASSRESLIKSVPTTESLINSIPSSISVTRTESSMTTSLASRLRARQASIDIVCSRPTASKTPKVSNLDYKSYAVNRSARKKEVLQRMRHIKKEIFKSIGVDMLGQAKTIKSPLVKKPKRSKIQIENVQILPNVQNEVLTPILNSQNLSPLLPMPHGLEKLTEEPSPKSSMTGGRKTLTPPKTSKSPNSASKSPPSLSKKKEKASESPSAKSQNAVASSKIPITPSTVCKKRENSNSLKRPATSPLLLDEGKPVKRCYKSPSQLKKEMATKSTTELESTQLGLSDSVVDFLQRDLRANRLNVESFLNEEMPVDDDTPDATISNTEENFMAHEKKESTNEGEIKEPTDVEKKQSDDPINYKNSLKEDSTSKKEEKMETSDSPKDTNNKNSADYSPEATILDDLLEQVEDELKPNSKANDESDDDLKKNTKVFKEIVKDYDEERDLDLLDIIGLKIIKVDDIEDFHTLEEVEEMEGRAQQMANVCKSLCKVFSSKQPEPEGTFKALRITVNQIFKVDISLSDVKRLVNLIVMWYANCYNGKLIEKKAISEATNKYLQMFHYIPKTVKRFYYCEFCEEHFNTEHRYYVHRIAHTGALNPYSCKYCNLGFNRINHQKTHEISCQTSKQSDKRELRRMTMKNENPKEFLISKSNINDEQRKAVVKTIYSCAKCEMKFSLQSEVKAHMAVCNRSLRRQPKMCTPRPKPKIEPYTKN